jgi:hypothetical protein
VIVSVRVGFVAGAHEARGHAAIVTAGLRKRFDWFSDAHRR